MATPKKAGARVQNVVLTTSGLTHSSSILKVNPTNIALTQEDQVAMPNSRGGSRSGRCLSGRDSAHKNASGSSSRQKNVHPVQQAKQAVGITGHSYLAQTLVAQPGEALSPKGVRKGLTNANEGVYSNQNISSRQRRDGSNFASAMQRNIQTASGGLRSGNTANRGKFVKRPYPNN